MPVWAHTHPLSPPLTYVATCLLAYSLTYMLAYLRAYSLTYLLTYLLTHADGCARSRRAEVERGDGRQGN